MDRSDYILAKDCDALKSEMRAICCDSLMLNSNNYEKVNCEKYGYRAEWARYAYVFQQKMIDCFCFKRDGRCPVAGLM
ncbi:MAG: hypothetical protein LBM77_01040 [Spirochaetaceae bacterium]|jgi:hypothetical protein|nr:hypothetical protein [Spirochaetaceae bacterium]